MKKLIALLAFAGLLAGCSGYSDRERGGTGGSRSGATGSGSIDNSTVAPENNTGTGTGTGTTPDNGGTGSGGTRGGGVGPGETIR